MAQAQIGNIMGFAASDVGTGTQKTNLNGGTTGNPQVGMDLDNLDTISSMRARLAVIDATFYTSARLDVLTMNDMAYAIRQNEAPLTIKQ